MQVDAGDPVILLVDRGRCTFVNKVTAVTATALPVVSRTRVRGNRRQRHLAYPHVLSQVRNAQMSSAQAVVIVDNKDERNLPLMADDGTGTDIDIPVRVR